LYDTFVHRFRASVFWPIPEFLKFFLFLFPQRLKYISRHPPKSEFSSKARKFAPYTEGRISGPRTDGRRRKTEMSFGLLDFGRLNNEGRRKNSQLYKKGNKPLWMEAGGKHTNNVWSIASAKNTKLTVLCELCGKKNSVNQR